jgi:hypothetical protein
MLPGTNPPDIRERKLRDWIFSLLRFAVTHSPDDQAAALTLAIELDRSGGPSELTFFQRTSLAVCRAMVVRDEDGNQILQQYLSRIEDPRLKNVFAPAIGRDDISLGHPRKKARRGLRAALLWRGLP